MKRPRSNNHHYVPQWYQKRFLPTGLSKRFYLDLKPQEVENGAHSYFGGILSALGWSTASVRTICTP
jgi:hypothetical protein